MNNFVSVAVISNIKIHSYSNIYDWSAIGVESGEKILDIVELAF